MTYLLNPKQLLVATAKETQFYRSGSDYYVYVAYGLDKRRVPEAPKLYKDIKSIPRISEGDYWDIMSPVSNKLIPVRVGEGRNGKGPARIFIYTQRSNIRNHHRGRDFVITHFEVFKYSYSLNATDEDSRRLEREREQDKKIIEVNPELNYILESRDYLLSSTFYKCLVKRLQNYINYWTDRRNFKKSIHNPDTHMAMYQLIELTKNLSSKIISNQLSQISPVYKEYLAVTEVNKKLKSYYA